MAETVLSGSDFASKLKTAAPVIPEKVDGVEEAAAFRPEFTPLTAAQMAGPRTQFRRVSVMIPFFSEINEFLIVVGARRYKMYFNCSEY